MTNKEKYKRCFETIAASEASFTDLTKKRRTILSHTWSVRIAIGLTCLFICLPITSYATEIKNFFLQIIGKDETLTEYIDNEIYQDNDGHVKMTVTELMSDSMIIRAILLYEALDEVGEEWIQSFSYEDEIKKASKIGGNQWPEISIIPDTLQTGSYAFQELPEYRTNRQLCLCASANLSLPASGTATLYYPMSTVSRNETTLDISCDKQTNTYILEGNNPVCEGYEVHYAVVTDFSCIIYGKNTGIWKRETLSNGGWAESLDADASTLPTVELILKDNSVISSMDCQNVSGLMHLEDDHIFHIKHPDTDFMILSFSHYTKPYAYGTGMEPIPQKISVENIRAIRINGKEFKLKYAK